MLDVTNVLVNHISSRATKKKAMAIENGPTCVQVIEVSESMDGLIQFLRRVEAPVCEERKESILERLGNAVVEKKHLSESMEAILHSVLKDYRIPPSASTHSAPAAAGRRLGARRRID